VYSYLSGGILTNGSLILMPDFNGHHDIWYKYSDGESSGEVWPKKGDCIEERDK